MPACIACQGVGLLPEVPEEGIEGSTARELLTSAHERCWVVWAYKCSKEVLVVARQIVLPGCGKPHSGGCSSVKVPLGQPPVLGPQGRFSW